MSPSEGTGAPACQASPSTSTPAAPCSSSRLTPHVSVGWSAQSCERSRRGEGLQQRRGAAGSGESPVRMRGAGQCLSLTSSPPGPMARQSCHRGPAGTCWWQQELSKPLAPEQRPVVTPSPPCAGSCIPGKDRLQGMCPGEGTSLLRAGVEPSPTSQRSRAAETAAAASRMLHLGRVSTPGKTHPAPAAPAAPSALPTCADPCQAALAPALTGHTRRIKIEFIGVLTLKNPNKSHPINNRASPQRQGCGTQAGEDTALVQRGRWQ